MKKISVDPITRLEGHGKIEIFVNDAGEVANVYFQIPELRGFERFCVGRPVEELARITPRTGMICSAPAGDRCRWAAARSTSARVISPPGPVGSTAVRSIPSSLASRRTGGLVRGRAGSECSRSSVERATSNPPWRTGLAPAPGGPASGV